MLDRLLASLPLVQDAGLANDATVRPDGVHLGASFALRPQVVQRAILAHEAAHWFHLDDWYLQHHEDWDLASKSDYGHLNGQVKPGEVMVEAYATLWSDPTFLAEHAPSLIAIVEEGARAVGLPLPGDSPGRMGVNDGWRGTEATLEGKALPESIDLA